MTEAWKPIAGFEGFYAVSDIGRVMRLDSCRVLKPSLSSKGYPMVTLCRPGVKRPANVHKLVAFAFIGPCFHGMQVNHKDEDKTNNCVGNLEYCTCEYNNNYGTRSERAASKLAKPVEAIDTFGRVTQYKSVEDASEKTGASRSCIRRCFQGKRHTAAGYAWRLAITPVEVTDDD